MASLDEAGDVAVVWLDGRNMSAPMHGHSAGAMTLRYAHVDRHLTVRYESELDARVCECCTTAMAMTAKGPVVAYRDRSETEIRDISIVRRVNGRWSAPAPLRGDNWKIAGCPVNGPQLDARGNVVVVAWFTAPDNKAQVKIAFSSDAGAKFAAPLRIDGGNAVGRADVVLLPDNSAVVTWIEGAGPNASIMARRAFPNGRLGTPQKIAATSAARASGFPRMALVGTNVYVAWTDPGTKRVRLARVDVR